MNAYNYLYKPFSWGGELLTQSRAKTYDPLKVRVFENTASLYSLLLSDSSTAKNGEITFNGVSAYIQKLRRSFFGYKNWVQIECINKIIQTLASANPCNLRSIRGYAKNGISKTKSIKF